MGLSHNPSQTGYVFALGFALIASIVWLAFTRCGIALPTDRTIGRAADTFVDFKPAGSSLEPLQ